MRLPALIGLAGLALTACGEDAPPGRTYYQRNIEPVLTQFCARSTGGCHAADPDDPLAFAAGNLDVTSFENVKKRADLLKPFGPYTVPVLLIKAVGATGELGVNYDGRFIPLEVQHSGGNILQVGSDAYLTLLEWMENGATENGLPPVPPNLDTNAPCSKTIPAGFDPTTYQDHAQFGQFRSEVQPVLDSCNSGNCHGAPQADFYVTCGDTDDEVAFNFSQAWAFVDDPVDNSPVLQVPLAVDAGGYFHSGGEHFNGRTGDSRYDAVKTWAEQVGKIEFGAGDSGKQFFADNVQPVLLARGCSFEACHSPAATNDFKARTGSQGFFSSIALERNYDLLKREFLAFEVPDVRRGRAVAKGIFPQYGGIAHRAGAVLTTPGGGASVPSSCSQPYDPATASAYCTFQEWLNIERQSLITAGQVLPLGNGDTVPIVYVDREATHVASLLEFDSYQAGSDLMVSTATLDADGAISAATAGASILAGCPGFGGRASADVRGPDVALDGNRVAFAMRNSASEPLSIYTVNLDGSNCQRITPPQPDVSGMKIHNFDPAWSPDGQWIVFASTRGVGGNGPSVSRKHFLPQSDIWRMRADGSDPEAMTFLTNSEISPQWMREGRVIMTTEKVSADFYQLAGRRINWDLTDYHPLLGQRATSPFADLSDPTTTAPSIGYSQVTEIREGFDGNFLIILSDEGARGGAGTLAIFNRSVGPFELNRSDPGFLKSMTIPDTAATGRVGSATSGAYRSPFPLPSGQIMASYANYSGDLGSATSLNWDIVAVDRRTGQRTPIIGGAGAQVEAVLALKYPQRKFFLNRRQLVFGGTTDTGVSGGSDRAVVHFPDAPLIFTLLNANLRRGRPVDLYRGATHVAFYRENPAPPGTTSGGGPGGIYENRTYLGRVALATDGSAKVTVPAGAGVIMELQDQGMTPIVTMREEHQLGPGELISVGIKADLFDGVCGGCHGSISGRELDITVTPDVLTGASESLSLEGSPATPQ